MWHSSNPNARSLSHSPSAPPPSFTQSPYPPRSLVRAGQTSPRRPRLVVSRSTCPPLSSPPPREQLCTRSWSNKIHTRPDSPKCPARRTGQDSPADRGGCPVPGARPDPRPPTPRPSLQRPPPLSQSQVPCMEQNFFGMYGTLELGVYGVMVSWTFGCSDSIGTSGKQKIAVCAFLRVVWFLGDFLSLMACW
jgi:hypothetical protein